MHAVTAGDMLDTVQSDAKVARALLKDGADALIEEYGNGAPPNLKFLLSMALNFDVLTYLRIIEIQAKYQGREDEAIVLVECGAPDRCTAPHVTPDDLTTQEDGTVRVHRTRESVVDIDAFLRSIMGGE